LAASEERVEGIGFVLFAAYFGNLLLFDIGADRWVFEIAL
jgi:hypothetical protein